MTLYSKLEKHLPREDSNGLLPCPFCGGEATLRTGGLENEYFHVRCSNLCVEQQQGITDKQKAINTWNTRPTKDVEKFIEEHMMECQDITDEVYVEAIDVKDVRRFFSTTLSNGLEENKLAKFLFDRCKNEKELEWGMLTYQAQMPYKTEAKAICSKFGTKTAQPLKEKET